MRDDIDESIEGGYDINSWDVDPRDPLKDRFEVVPRNSKSRKSGSSNIHKKNYRRRSYGQSNDLESTFSGQPKSSKRKTVSFSETDTKSSSSVYQDTNIKSTLDSFSRKSYGSNNLQSNTSSSSYNDGSANVNNTNARNVSKNNRLRSSGLDSLFSSTAKSDNEKLDDINDLNKNKNRQRADNDLANSASAETTNPISNNFSSDKTQIISSNSPDDNYSVSVSDRKVNQARKVSVIKPMSYDCIKDISDTLQNKDALVISLKHTSSSLSRRILDFTFGAASMCNATIEVVCEKTYAVTIGESLSQREKIVCSGQGVLIG